MNDLLSNAYKFLPDWTDIWNKDELNIKFDNLVFKGCGWYVRKNDYMLIVPFISAGNTLYKVCVWNNSDPFTAFNEIVNAPIQQDAR